MQGPLQPEEGVRFHGAGVTGSFDLWELGAENEVLFKSSSH